jgi:hypothetical protein
MRSMAMEAAVRGMTITQTAASEVDRIGALMRDRAHASSSSGA